MTRRVNFTYKFSPVEGLAMDLATNIQYSSASPRCKLDIFRPEAGTSLETAVIQIHGGAFRAGAKEMVHPRARQLCSLGYTVIPIDYRLLPEHPWPSAVDDLQAAIDWVIEHAGDLKIRTERIVTQGFSAGGYLALLAASPGACRWYLNRWVPNPP